ncbi:MAG: oligosaccharide flippase family protein [bacterium]|nr:oligosaccharide flippase family protein [bacterium]
MSGRVEVSRRLILINSASSVAARLLSVTVLVWMHRHLLERISEEEYALFPVVTAVIVFVPLLNTVLTSGVARYVTAAYSRDDETEITRITSTVLVLAGLASILLLVFGSAFSWLIDRFLTIPDGRLGDARLMMFLLVVQAAAQLALMPLGVGFSVRQKFVHLNLIRVGGELLRIALLLILLLGVSTRVLWVVVATVAAGVVTLLALTVVSRRMLPALRFRAGEFRFATARELTSFGGWMTLGQLASMIHMAAHTIILNKLSTAAQVTYYNLGNFPNKQVQGMASVVTQTIHPAVTSLHTSGETERIRRAFLAGGRYSLWAAMALAAPLIVYHRELFELYLDSSFAAAGVVMALTLACFPFTHSNSMLPVVAMASARVRGLCIAAILIQLTNVALALILVGVFELGAIGCAISTLVTSTLGQVLVLWPIAMRIAGISLARFARETLWPGLLPALAGFAAWLVLPRLRAPETWIELGLYGAGGMLAYAAVLWLHGLTVQERDRMRRALRSRWSTATP